MRIDADARCALSSKRFLALARVVVVVVVVVVRRAIHVMPAAHVAHQPTEPGQRLMAAASGETKKRRGFVAASTCAARHAH